MKKHVVLISTILIMAQGIFALDGTQIAEKAHEVSKSKTTHSVVLMELIDDKGNIDSRMIEEFGQKVNDLSSTVMVFRSPASVKDTRFMQKENEDRADDKFIYLPALKRVRRVSTSDGSKSFMGTDLTYDDMETRAVARDTHDLLKEESINGVDCYVVKAKSVDPNDSQYAYRISWIRKDNFVPIKTELYDKSENLFKVMTVLDLDQVNGYWTPMKIEMANIQSNHKTVLTMKKIVFDSELSSNIFSQRFLQTGRAN